MVFDGAGEGMPLVGCSCAELERTGLSAQPAAISCRFKEFRFAAQKNRTCIGPHPKGQKHQ